ncbi:hypothetical protein N7454_004577 [Penicillium verhagenii]|nr:hypothetical protein N7454_004577 [Penicillium verhagenii]
MQFSRLLATAALVGSVTAFTGSMAASAYAYSSSGLYEQIITLTDFTSGSVYEGYLWGGFNECTSTECTVDFSEITDGNYAFAALMWRTSDGCHNIDFEGALSSEHGYCCGSLPCDFTA